MTKIWVERDPEVPLVYFRWIFPGGSASEGREQEGLTNFALESIRRGSRKRDRKQTARWLAEVASHVSMQVAPDQAQITALVPMSSLSEFIDRLLVVAREADPTVEQLEGLRRELIEGFRVGLENPGTRAAILWRRLLFGESGWGNLSTGSPYSLQKMQALDMAVQRNSLLQTSGWLTLGGDVPMSEADIAIQVGDDGVAEPLQGLPAIAQESKLGLWHDPHQEQATVILGWSGPELVDRNLIESRLVEKILCSDFTSHLCQDFRQRGGLTYGISGAHQVVRGGSVFVLKTSTGSEFAPRFVEDLLGALQTFTGDGATYDVRGQNGAILSRRVEFDPATVGACRDRVLLSLPFRFHTPQARLGRLVDHVLYGAPAPRLDVWQDLVSLITAESLAERARQLFVGRKPIVAIVDNMERNGDAYRNLLPWTNVVEGDERICGLN